MPPSVTSLVSSIHPIIRKTVIFHSENLGKDITVIFLFDEYDGKHDAPVTCHPVVWKKAYFGQEEHYSKTLEYTDQLTFTIPDTGDLNFRYPENGSTSTSDCGHHFGSNLLGAMKSPFSPAKPGHTLTVKRTEDRKDFKLFESQNEHVSSFSPAGSALVVKNDAGEKIDSIVLGFLGHPGTLTLPQFVRVFRNIGVGRSLHIFGFKPILRAFVTSAYEEGDVPLERTSGQLIWSRNLDELSEKTQWRISYDAEHGIFVVGQTE